LGQILLACDLPPRYHRLSLTLLPSPRLEIVVSYDLFNIKLLLHHYYQHPPLLLRNIRVFVRIVGQAKQLLLAISEIQILVKLPIIDIVIVPYQHIPMYSVVVHSIVPEVEYVSHRRIGMRLTP